MPRPVLCFLGGAGGASLIRPGNKRERGKTTVSDRHEAAEVGPALEWDDCRWLFPVPMPRIDGEKQAGRAKAKQDPSPSPPLSSLDGNRQARIKGPLTRNPKFTWWSGCARTLELLF